jgi:hypothetical protein
MGAGTHRRQFNRFPSGNHGNVNVHIAENHCISIKRLILYQFSVEKEMRGSSMENYAMRGHTINHYMTVIQELEDSFLVRIVNDHGGREEVSTRFIHKDFFDKCIRTGYFSKVEIPEKRTINTKLAVNA